MSPPMEWGACGWSVVQLDHDEEVRPMHGMCGTVDAELEVQRTIKRAGLTAILCHLRKAIGPVVCMLITKGSLMGCGECIGPETKGAWWIMILEELHRVQRGGTLGRVRHDAIAPKRKYSKMSLFAKFITASGDFEQVRLYHF